MIFYYYRERDDILKKKAIFKKILLGLLIVAVVLAVATAVTNFAMYKSHLKRIAEYSPVNNPEAIVPVEDENGEFTFVTDRELKILHMTDVHFGGGWMSFNKDRMSINAVATMIQTEKPDLVVVTGDIAYPVPFQAGTFNNKTSAMMFITLMEQLEVPWTVTFGNHDTESYSYYSREKVSGFYADESLKYCLFSKGPEDIDGYGNHVIHVKNTAGVITQELIFMDSHSYTDGDIFGLFWKYDNIKQNQVDWYKDVITNAQKNNPDVKSLLFFHIPLVEYRDAYDELLANDKKATANAEIIAGKVGEKDPYVYCGMHEDNLFETILELGSTQATFCGHDRLNNIVMRYKGVDLTYGMSVDYLAYVGISKQGTQRGCTVITVNPDGSYTQSFENYYQDKYDPLYPKEEVTFE